MHSTALLLLIGLALVWGRPQFQLDPNARSIKMEETAVSSTTTITTSTTRELPMLLLDPELEEAVGGNFLLEGPVLHIWGLGAGVVFLTFLVLSSMAGCALQARCPFKNRGKKEERKEKDQLRRRMGMARLQVASDRLAASTMASLPPPAPTPSCISERESVLTIKRDRL